MKVHACTDAGAWCGFTVGYAPPYKLCGECHGYRVIGPAVPTTNREMGLARDLAKTFTAWEGDHRQSEAFNSMVQWWARKDVL